MFQIASFLPLEMASVEVYIRKQTIGRMMSVFKRKTTHGETSEYHYRFMKSGKLYFGVCDGCYTQDDAEKYEASIRETVSELSMQRSVKALVENFRDELAGGEKIALDDAFAAAEEKPRRHSASLSHRNVKASQFADFVCFMNQKFPDIIYINQVLKRHAEAYIQQLRTFGRFGKEIRSGSGNYANRNERLASSTINRFHKTMREVFSLLAEDVGLYSNPFALVPMLDEEQETREAFSEKELELIMQKAPPFIRSIFLVGFFTALREGDISTLRWSDVLWEQGIIRRKLLKTGAIVEIPIMPPLAAFLREQEGRDDEYVLPEHAAMYLKNPSGISYRVKKFLEGDLGISTTKKVPGRTRSVSVKDVHSLRHTFCYFAGVAGIPLVVVQSIVGHMTPEMTAHYTAHADRKTKREKLASLPCFKALVTETERKVLIEQTRLEVIEAIKKADSETIRRVASMILPVKPKRLLLHSTEPERSS